MKAPFRFTSLLSLAFGLVALLFVSSTLVVTWFGQEITARNEDVISNALPSIMHLNAANDALRDLEMISDDYPDVADPQRAEARRAIEQKWHTVDAELTTYLGLPQYPGERELYESTVPRALRDVNAGVVLLLAQVESHETAGARTTADRVLSTATGEASHYLRNMVAFNAVRAEDDLKRIDEIHRSSARRAFMLDGATLICVLMLTLFIHRRFRAHDKLLADHSTVLEERAAELEMFGQRVAHDMLSPLSALTYCLGAFKRAAEAEPKLSDALVRARACVSRAEEMVRGIFDFARAGGKPDPGAHADVYEVIQQVREDVRSADDASRPEVVVEPFTPCVVGCSPGVLTSVLSNVMRNAAKFMSDSAVRTITVRVHERESAIRIDVMDTGPGVPRHLQQRIFEPYVRAEGVTQPGLGLGLATVKRLCEAHGGNVDVRPREGHGSVFRVTLPKATDVSELTPPVSAKGLRLVSAKER